MSRDINKRPRTVLGIFGTPVTRWNKKFDLKDGGAALFISGELKVAISEERLNRIKHSSGYEKSVNYCLKKCDLTESDIDLIVLGNCCDFPFHVNDNLQGLLLRNYEKLRIVESHHESHAILAALQSGFDECIVMVADNEGNLLNQNDELNYWNNSLERVSFFVFRNGKLQLLERNCDESDNIGLGDTYHYFTHYLGWNSYTQAGRVMGLSAYGDRSVYRGYPLFTLDANERIHAMLENNRPNKYNVVKEYGEKFRPTFPPPRKSGDTISQDYMDVAAWVQKELENILSKKIKKLITKTGISKICLSGGIAYNCLANRIINDLPEVSDFFIPYAPGDEGQPIGNAILEMLHFYGHDEIKIGSNSFLGESYSNEDIVAAISRHPDLEWSFVENIESKTAELLSNQKIIGWFQNGSEMGSRALGNRSVLCDPRFLELKDEMNARKGREWYRPVAPSVLEEFQEEYFDNSKYIPFMNIAAVVKDEARDKIPVVTHRDNTARLQTVRQSDNPVFHKLIKEFYRITGVPVLGNTSFNSNGEPIVESPGDAINSFLKMNLDYLILGNYIITI